MRVFSIESKNGEQFAFAVENIGISISQLEQIFSKVPGLVLLQRRRLFSLNEGIHLRYRYQGSVLLVYEPWGDSSRYWIGPVDPTVAVDLSEVRQKILEYKPSWPRRAVAFCLSLDGYWLMST